MNLNANPTMDQLRDLLKRCDDYAGHHVLWVRKSGDVEVTRLAKGQTPFEFEQSHPDMQIRFETFQGGNEYVGAEAAANDDWVQLVLDRLVKEWPTAQNAREVKFLDVSGAPVENHFAWR
jgi:hypothetical protein